MLKRTLQGAAALAAAALVLLAMPQATPRVEADPGRLARTEYGYRLAPQATVPPNCTNPDRQCIWLKASDGKLYLHNTDGTDLPWGGNVVGSITLQPSGTPGLAGIQIAQLGNRVNDTFYGLTAGANAYGDGIAIVAATTCAMGDVLVWSGSRQVSRASATTNLTTIAGIAAAPCTAGQPVRMVVRGLALVSADNGISAGQVVGTSSSQAGRVQAATAPPASAAIGRAIESSAATVAGFVLVAVDVG